MSHYQRSLVLLPLGPVRARAMFGGWGLFLDDTMFGLIAGERLYFKVDDETEPRFAAAGAEAFTYLRQGKRAAMSYWEAPSGAGGRLPWAELGLEAAQRAREKRRPKARQKKARRHKGRYR